MSTLVGQLDIRRRPGTYTTGAKTNRVDDITLSSVSSEDMASSTI